jgi:hypothetical protein
MNKLQKYISRTMSEFLKLCIHIPASAMQVDALSFGGVTAQSLRATSIPEAKDDWVVTMKTKT